MATHCPKCDFKNPSDSKFCKECGTQLIAAEDIPAQDLQPSFTKTLLTPIDDLTQGTLFAGRYEIIEELGKGGMGKVYKALDNEIHEEVAIKLLKPEIAADEKIIERFRNELKIARKITHKNVCRTYDIGREEATPYITMEYVQGEDLKSLIKKKSKLSNEEALGIAKQVCLGLAEAHELSVVHRDLKPQNIMIDESGTAKIMDFGIARSVEAEGVTEAGMIIGTPDYISPEQAEGEEADHRSDIYSLGVILYEMVTGTVPFKGDTALSVALKHKSQFPLDPRKLNPDVTDDLSKLILICMEKDKERRYQSAEVLLNDLQNIEEGLPLGTKIQPRRATFTQTLIRKKFFVPVMIMVLAIVVVAIWQFLPKREVAYAPKIENSIAIISFENLTGDENNDNFQKSIPNLLRTNLENTGYFYVPTLERMRDLLKQMGKSEVEFIDSDLGFELCRRDGVGALVVGSLNKAGDMFVTDVNVYDVETKKSIKSVSSKGIGEQSLFESQINELSKEISIGMGLAQEKIETTNLQIKDVSTSSTEAYNYFLEGREYHMRWYIDDARQSYEKAIELDPTFASAYYHLSRVNSNLGNWKASYDAIEKAKTFLHKATEKERLFVEARYAGAIEKDYEKKYIILQQLIEKYPKEKEAYHELGIYYFGTGDGYKAIEAFEGALKLDPTDRVSLNEMGLIYMSMKDYENAQEYLRKAIDAWPNNANQFDTLAFVYWRMGKPDEAIEAYKEAINIKPDFEFPYVGILCICALHEDYDETIKWIDVLISIASPKLKQVGYVWKGHILSWIGNFTQSFASYQRAYELSEAAGGGNRSSITVIGQYALIYYDRGELEISRQWHERWRNFMLGFRPFGPIEIFYDNYILGLIEIKEGHLDLAKTRLEKMKAAYPDFKGQSWIDWGASVLKFVEAEILLSEGSYEEAVSILEKQPTQWLAKQFIHLLDYQQFFIMDILARAFQKTGKLDKAIEEYERLITYDPKSKDQFLIHPKYHYRLAKLYEEKGQDRKAIEQYEIFLDLWKNADERLPEPEDARERLGALKN